MSVYSHFAYSIFLNRYEWQHLLLLLLLLSSSSYSEIIFIIIISCHFKAGKTE